MKLNTKVNGRLAAAGTALTLAATAVGISLLGGGAATAAEPGERQAVAPANSVYSGSIVNGQVFQSDLAPAVNTAYLSTYNNTVGFPALKSDVAAKLNLGEGSVVKTVAPTAIVTMGGSFATGKTKVGEFNLPAGRWLVNTSGFFLRTVAGVEGTRPQLALRIGDSYGAPIVWGTDAGTVMGAEISESVNREVTGSDVKVVTLAAPATVNVYGFGYNDDTSAAGSGQITVKAQISAVRIG
ncbi:MAG TPA: hypothetical protein VFG33_03820 [Kribbella sp.]|uniref:hypothetical protein n=1 Tax=Kribbella sp. TaxID=1871183 RepID=UPI002D77BDB0|nr:hypothetical protein [Kribbella sp.]HET6292470.1 hypothetical protein [Kribbella sp.]